MLQDTISDQAFIEAATLTLRPLRYADEGAITLNAGDGDLARRTSSIPHPYPPGAARALIERAQAAERVEDIWAIDGTRIGADAFMGLISLRRLGDAQSDVSYWVARAFQGSGVATQAVQALIAANPQGCRTLFASVFQDNPASARVLTNCGFVYIGDAESFSVARRATVPTWTYTLKCR